jgi:hypothetical protein
MARKNQNTFEKRRRDMEKKLRAEDKRKKRIKRKAEGDLKGPLTSESSLAEDAANFSRDPGGA